jgi:hypothetical protein
MKPTTAEWVAKAEGDFRTACREQMVEARYPGMVADAEDAAEAVRTATLVRTAVRVALGIETPQENPHIHLEGQPLSA